MFVGLCFFCFSGSNSANFFRQKRPSFLRQAPHPRILISSSLPEGHSTSHGTPRMPGGKRDPPRPTTPLALPTGSSPMPPTPASRAKQCSSSLQCNPQSPEYLLGDGGDRGEGEGRGAGAPDPTPTQSSESRGGGQRRWVSRKQLFRWVDRDAWGAGKERVLILDFFFKNLFI